MRIRLNLATNPQRNRRFFFFLAGLLSAITLALFLTSLWFFIRWWQSSHHLRRELTQIARLEEAARREEKQYQAKLSSLTKELQAQVDQANSLIKQKSFPWSDFFSRLEKALPDACYITSLNLISQSESQLEVRLKLSSPDLASLLTTLEQLNATGFRKIRVENENQGPGALISEVMMTYERPD